VIVCPRTDENVQRMLLWPLFFLALLQIGLPQLLVCQPCKGCPANDAGELDNFKLLLLCQFIYKTHGYSRRSARKKAILPRTAQIIYITSCQISASLPIKLCDVSCTLAQFYQQVQSLSYHALQSCSTGQVIQPPWVLLAQSAPRLWNLF
jgi:hypothetical protein